jgi:hypothetical protein
MVVNITESVDFVPIPKRVMPAPAALEYTPTVPPGQTVIYAQSVPPQETITIDQSDTLLEEPSPTTFNQRRSDYTPSLVRRPEADLNTIGANYYNNQFAPLRENTQWGKEMGSLFSTLG